jgi:hypothetical protein
MQVVDRLAAVESLVDDDAVTAGGELAARARSEREEIANLAGFGHGYEVAQIVRMAAGHDEQVNRRLRIEVAEDQRVVGAQNLVGHDLAPEDLAEHAGGIGVAHGCTFGLSNSKLMTSSGRAMTPRIEESATNVTTECTSGTAGTWSWIIALARS